MKAGLKDILLRKKMLFFTSPPNSGNLYCFFRRRSSIFKSQFRTKNTKYILRIKKQKPCCKNCPDKTHQFSNLRQICITSVFANFKHNHGVQIYSYWCINKRSRSPRHIEHYIIRTLFRFSGHIF